MNITSDGHTRAGSTGAGWLHIIPGLAVVVAFGLRTISNSDFWMHLASGRWISSHGVPDRDPFSFATSADQAWVNATWLYDRFLFTLWQLGGPTLITLCHVAAVAAAFIMLSVVARRYSDSTAVSIALILAAWLLAPRFTVRPLTLCLVWPALYIFFMSRGTPSVFRWIYLLLAQVLWTNLHPSFMLGPFLAALFAVERWAALRHAATGTDEASALKAQAQNLTYLAPALLLCTWVNPFGTELHRHLFAIWSNAILHSYVTPSPFHLISTMALVVIASGFVLYKNKLPLALTCIGVAGAFLLVFKFVDIAAILTFPFIALSLSATGQLIASKIERVRAGQTGWAATCTVVVATLLSLLAVISNFYFTATGSASRSDFGIEQDMFPGKACAYLIGRADFPTRALNLATDGGFLAWTLPDRKIFTDTRDDLYDVAFYQQFASALQGNEEQWDRIMDRWQLDAIILNCTWPGAGLSVHALIQNSKWRLIYFDGTTAVLLRMISEQLQLIRDTAVQSEGLRLIETAYRDYNQRLTGGKCPGNSPRLIGAATVFQSLGQFKEAADIYKLLTQGAPVMGSGWLGLGICQFKLNKPEEALISLKRASKLMPKDVLPWLWLGKTYSTLGLEKDAIKAYSKARTINPALYQAFHASMQIPSNRMFPKSTAPDR